MRKASWSPGGTTLPQSGMELDWVPREPRVSTAGGDGCGQMGEGTEVVRAVVCGSTQVPSPWLLRACSSFRRCRHWYRMSSSGRRGAWEEDGAGVGMGAGAGVACAVRSGSLMESGVKVMEKGERPSELTGNEELPPSLGLREEVEETEALLRLSSLAALLCKLSVSKSSRDEFHVLRLCCKLTARV